MRNKFDEQLALLNVELIKMGSLCELAISNAVKGLLEDNRGLLKLVADTDKEIDEKEREIESMCFKLLLQQQPVARDLRTIDNRGLLKLVADTDKEIDEKEREIESMCFKLLLQQQPVARDLRTISAALKMISDLERIGDQASDIAEIAGFIEGDHTKDHTHISAMGQAASAMVTDAVKSFVNRDLNLAHSVMKDDDVVDNHFEEVKKEIVNLIRKEEAGAELSLDLLMIAKYLERIGDHAVNVAEWVEFSITGEHLSDELRK